MTIEATTHPETARAFTPDSLPSAVRVLAVTARPGQESADLGGPLYAFRRSGASLSLLCLTLGETSAPSSGFTRREAARPWEVQMAASILGIRQVTGSGTVTASIGLSSQVSSLSFLNLRPCLAFASIAL